MRRLLFFVFAAFLSLSLNAQNDRDSVSEKHVVYGVVPSKLNIKDKIIVRNRSPYWILQTVVALADGVREEALGSATLIGPNETRELASYRNNWLKNLRGRLIAIKAKGLKLMAGDQSHTSVYTPYGSVSVRRKELDKEILNNIKPEDVTYDFSATLFEANHDLYIELFANNGKGVFDF